MIPMFPLRKASAMAWNVSRGASAALVRSRTTMKRFARGACSEHLVHHFHKLCYEAIRA